MPVGLPCFPLLSSRKRQDKLKKRKKTKQTDRNKSTIFNKLIKGTNLMDQLKGLNKGD